MNEALDFPLPPTTGTYVTEPRLTPEAVAPALAPAPPPELDELTALRAKVAELEQVVALAKTRVETLGAEKREALERALLLEAQLEAATQPKAEPVTNDDQTLAGLLHRVAALEAIVSRSHPA